MPSKPEDPHKHERLRLRISGRYTMYSALPSRRFMSERTRVFLDFLVKRVRIQQHSAIEACKHF